MEPRRRPPRRGIPEPVPRLPLPRRHRGHRTARRGPTVALNSIDFRVDTRRHVDLAVLPTAVKALYTSHKNYKKQLKKHVKKLSALQQLHYASDHWALLLIFQGMDAAGKDGAIRHVMSGVNPQGCQVFSFKQPTDHDLEHDFLWRTTCNLPERGRIGIFNRSYYEDVLIARVHPEILHGHGLPLRRLPTYRRLHHAEHRLHDRRVHPRRVTDNQAMQPASLTGTVRYLVASDPGRLRLRSAVATTLSLVLAMVALLGFTGVSKQPLTVAMLGTIVAMQSSAAVKDRPAQSGRHHAAAVLPGGRVGDARGVSVAVGQDRRGRLHCGALRGGVGSPVRSARQCHGHGRVRLLFFRPLPAGIARSVPRACVVVAIGLSASLLVRTLIFPDRPGVELRRLIRALRAASTSVLDVASNRNERDLALLRRRLNRLGETALMIDDWLDRNDAGLLLSVTNEDLALWIFMHNCHRATGEPVVGTRPGRRVAGRSRGHDHSPANVPAEQSAGG